MGIEKVQFAAGSRGGTLNSLYQRTYRLKFLVETDARTVGAKSVLAAKDPGYNPTTPVPGTYIPAVGNTFSDGDDVDLGSFVQSLSAEEDGDSGVQWVVTADYGPYDSSVFGPDPTLWPIRVSWSGTKMERVVWFDINGDPIVNSAGDRYEDPVTIDETRVTLLVRKNILVSAWDVTLPYLYNDAINQYDWNGFPAYAVKCGSITTSDEQYDSYNQIWYYTVTFPFELDRNKWKKDQLDQGFAELDSSSPPRQKLILDAKGQPVGEAVPLDGSGHRLETGDPPVKNEYDVYDEIDFAGLNLDFAFRLGV